MLSFLRLLMIPVIVWLYVGLKEPLWAFAVIFLSGVTDVADGFIARHFNMITDFGKMIDPVADKLTQVAILFCLVTRFRLMLIPICIMAVKEITSFLMRLRLFQKSEEVYGAVWHGKANTVILYAVICLHIVWFKIPFAVSTVLILITSGFMVFSFILYTIACAKYLSKSGQKENDSLEAISEEK